MELGCALMENLIKPFDEELFHKGNQNLQCPIVFHAMTRFRSLFSKEMVESRRELEEREKRGATLALMGRLGREF